MMEKSPFDVLKVIAFHLSWQDILSLSKVGRKFRLLRSPVFWREAIGDQQIVSKYDNWFLIFLHHRIKFLRMNYGHFRHTEYFLVGQESRVLAKHLKQKYPNSFRFYYFDIYTKSDHFIPAKLQSLNLKKYNLVYLTVSIKTDRCKLNCKGRGRFSKICGHHDRFYSEVYFMIDDQIENITVKRVNSREMISISVPSTYAELLDDYGICVFDTQFLYNTKEFRFDY